MDPYTTKGQARIQHRDIGAVLGMNSYLAGASLAALERQRGWQADAEVAWLLKQHGITPTTAASLVSLLRQTIGRALVGAGDRLTGVSRSGLSPKTPPAVGTLGTIS
jgi:hypothetical protein